MIQTNSQGRKLYVLRRISTGEILHRNVTYPNAVDDSVIEGFDPDLEFLAIDKDAQPEPDPRYFSVLQSEEKVGALWKISFTTPKRPLLEIQTAVTNTEALRNRDHYTDQERDKLMFLGMGVLFSVLGNQSLTAKQTAVKNRVTALAAKIWKNDTRAAALLTDVNANLTPDMDILWEPPAA